MKIREVRVSRARRGGHCTVGFTFTSARQFTDEYTETTVGRRWLLLALLKGWLVARKHAKAFRAKPAYHARNRVSNRLQSWLEDVPVNGRALQGGEPGERERLGWGAGVVFLALLLPGCFGGRPPAIQKAEGIKTEALMVYSANMNAIAKATEEGYRAEGQAHTDTVLNWDLEMLEKKADAAGKVDAKEASAWTKKVTTEWKANRGKVDAKVYAVQAIREKAQKDLITAMELQRLLDQFHDAGVPPEMIGEAAGAIGSILMKKDPPAIPAPTPAVGR